jgi:hypothetical protein
MHGYEQHKVNFVWRLKKSSNISACNLKCICFRGNGTHDADWRTVWMHGTHSDHSFAKPSIEFQFQGKFSMLTESYT